MSTERYLKNGKNKMRLERLLRYIKDSLNLCFTKALLQLMVCQAFTMSWLVPSKMPSVDIKLKQAF